MGGRSRKVIGRENLTANWIIERAFLKVIVWANLTDNWVMRWTFYKVIRWAILKGKWVGQLRKVIVGGYI